MNKIIVLLLLLIVLGVIWFGTHPYTPSTPPLLQGNVLQNPGFEQGLTSWTIESQNISHITNDSYSGTSAILIGGYVDQLLDSSKFSVGDWYTVSLKYKPAPFQLYSFNGDGYIYGLMERNMTGWLPPLGNYWGVLLGDSDVGNGWRQVQFKFQILASFSKPHFTIGILQSGYVIVDDVSLT